MMDMTSPSSYLFYDQFYPERGIQEGTLLNQVFVTETEVEIYSQVMRKTETGDLVGVSLAKHIYSWHLNKTGTRYLKQSCHKPGELFKDISFDIVINLDSNANPPAEFDPVTLECAGFVESVVLSWFGDEFSPEINDIAEGSILFPSLDSSSQTEKLAKLINGLYFPALRDTSFLVNEEQITSTGFKIVLKEWQDFNSETINSLRDNDSYDAFIGDICHPNVIRSSEDVRILKNYPRELFLLSMMNLENSMSSLWAKYGNSLLYIFGSQSLQGAFSAVDGKLIYFMLTHLSPAGHGKAIDLLLKMSDYHRTYTPMWDAASKGINPSLYPLFDRVPSTLSSQLAEELLCCLQQTSDDLLSDPDSHILAGAAVGEVKIDTLLVERFNSWFHENVLRPSISTSMTTLSTLEEKFFGLFGVPLPTGKNGESLSFYIGDTFSFAAVSEIYDERIPSYFSPFVNDLFSNLDKLVSDNRPMDKGSGCDAVSFSPYETEYGSFYLLTAKIYSLDDIKSIIERGAAITDEYLRKLDRKRTPENRAAFLTWGVRSRGFKNYWKYYDWGITDPAKIFALKGCGVVEEEMVQLYSALPDEMFAEFISLELPNLNNEEAEALADKVMALENAQFLDIDDVVWPTGREYNLGKPTWQGYRTQLT